MGKHAGRQQTTSGGITIRSDDEFSAGSWLAAKSVTVDLPALKIAVAKVALGGEVFPVELDPCVGFVFEASRQPHPFLA